jgi:outer membrane biosynthesis protein TonB
VTELAELGNPDEKLFAVSQSTPPAERLRSIVVDEATARKLSVSTPDILWPTVRSGKTSGVLSMYVSIDRSGRGREAWPLNSDNAGLNDAARQQVMRWQFKPASADGAPIQVETILTFAFNTKIGDPIPILSDADARKLAEDVIEPVFPPGSAPSGTVVKVEIGVGLDGAVSGASNLSGAPTPLFLAAYNAVRQWHFRPYLRDGKPDLFGADIVFRVP